MTDKQPKVHMEQAGEQSELQRLAEIWYRAGRSDAIRDVIEEWEKPWGLTDGRPFRERLKDMK